MLKKKRTHESSEMAEKFDDFIKKRKQKQAILQSNEQSISNKVSTFEELLKLNKAETNNNNHQDRNHQDKNNQHYQQQLLINKFKTSKNINFNKPPAVCQEENTEEWDQLNKFKSEPSDKNYEKKHSLFDKKSFEALSTLKREVKSSKDQRNTFSKYYKSNKISRNASPKKHLPSTQLVRLQRTKYHPKAKIQGSTIEVQKDHLKFTELKNQIKIFETTAKSKLGMNFTDFKEVSIEEPSLSPSKQVRHLFTKIEGQANPINSDYAEMVKENETQDPSIPLAFLSALPTVNLKVRKQKICSSLKYLRI